MKKRIFITGVSGVGKTTLAKYISENYNIPYVSTSASQVWDKYGFKNHADALQACLADPILGHGYQLDIFKNRVRELQNHGEFVTDRSPIDNLVYYLLQQGYYSEVRTTEFSQMCRDVNQMFEARTIFLKIPEGFEVENNGKRIVNIHYQRLVESVMEHVINTYFYDTHLSEIKTWDIEVKRVMVYNIMNHA